MLLKGVLNKFWREFEGYLNDFFLVGSRVFHSYFKVKIERCFQGCLNALLWGSLANWDTLTKTSYSMLVFLDLQEYCKKIVTFRDCSATRNFCNCSYWMVNKCLIGTSEGYCCCFWFCHIPVLGLGLGVDFSFAWDSHKNNKNDNDNPHLNFLERTVLGYKEQGVRIRDKR